MVKNLKKTLFFCLFVSEIFAASSLELAQDLVANPNFDAKLKLLFEGKNYVDAQGNAKWDEIARILKMNSLFSSTLTNSRSLQLSFRAKSDALLFIKIINEALNQAGFAYFTPIELSLKGQVKSYTLRVESRYILDPASFYNILKQNFVVIKSIRKVNAYDYDYELDFSKARLKPNTQVTVGVNESLQRPLRDYLIQTQGASSINIKAKAGDNWFPKVLFLDKDLKLIKSTMDSSKRKEFSSSIPSDVVYAIVGDNFNTDNIRRGLEIQLLR